MDQFNASEAEMDPNAEWRARVGAVWDRHAPAIVILTLLGLAALLSMSGPRQTASAAAAAAAAPAAPGFGFQLAG